MCFVQLTEQLVLYTFYVSVCTVYEVSPPFNDRSIAPRPPANLFLFQDIFKNIHSKMRSVKIQVAASRLDRTKTVSVGQSDRHVEREGQPEATPRT